MRALLFARSGTGDARVCGIPIAREAQTSNLQACGGCDMRLAQRIGAELATTKVVPYASMAWHIR